MVVKVVGVELLKEVEDFIFCGLIEVCCFMYFDDVNLVGNVYGGMILKLIEEGGFIIVIRYCNRNWIKDEFVLVVLVCVERIDFI